MPLQLLTWRATSQAASLLGEGAAEGPGVVEAAAGVAAGVALGVKEEAAEVVEAAAGVTAGVEGVVLGLSEKAKVVVTGQARLAEQQRGAELSLSSLKALLCPAAGCVCLAAFQLIVSLCNAGSMPHFLQRGYLCIQSDVCPLEASKQ